MSDITTDINHECGKCFLISETPTWLQKSYFCFRFTENDSGHCEEKDDGFDYMVNHCVFKFTMAEPNFQIFQLTFVITSHFAGYPSLTTSFSTTLMFDYPKAQFVNFAGKDS